VALPKKAAPAGGGVSLFGLVECCQMLAMLPGWVWVMVSGSAVVVLLSFGANHLMLSRGLERDLWGTILMGVGGLTLFVAHVAALVVIAPHDDRLSGKDLFFPSRLWTLTLKRLPATRWQFCIWVWGLTLVLSAKFIMGGLPIRFGSEKPPKVSLAAPSGVMTLPAMPADRAIVG
jgi:hypothetical protein